MAAVVTGCTATAALPEPDMLGRSAVIGQVFELTNAAPIAGARVCLHERESHCTTTDDEGTFQLDALPDGMELLVAVEAEGFVRGLRMLRTGNGTMVDLGGTVLPRIEVLAAQRDVLQIEQVEGTGYVAFYVVNPAWQPVFSVRAHVPSDTGDGPFYFNQAGEIDPLLLTGTDAAGYIYNVPPSELPVALTTQGAVASEACEQELEGLGWGMDDTGAGHRTPVVADSMTFVIGVCPASAENP